MYRRIRFKHFFFVVFIFLLGMAQGSFAQGQTINGFDTDNKKSGPWQLISDDGILLEEGSYYKGLKEGIWKGFYPDGTIKHEITFKEGIANGPAKFYFPDGSIWEEGVWREAFWVGEYRLYHPGGQPAYEFNYNSIGKRQGEQRYYYPDGTIKYKGKWEGGSIDGHVEVYDSIGQLQTIRNYEDGVFENSSEMSRGMPEDPASSSDKVISPFHGTGYHTAYKLNGNIYQKGYYREGVLHNGEEYVYDNSGKLRQIRIYDNGKLVKIKSGTELESKQ